GCLFSPIKPNSSIHGSDLQPSCREECRCAYVLLALGSARTFRAASLGASTCDPRSDRGPSLGRYHSPLGLRPRDHVSRRRTGDWRPRAYSVGLCISLRFASWPKLAKVKSRCLFLAVLR